MRHRERLIGKALGLICVLALLGCGDHGGGPGTGGLRFVIHWPARPAESRFIPQGANSLKIEVRREARPLAEAVAARHPDQPTAQVEIRDLPAGPVEVAITAHASTDGTGQALAEGTVQMTVVPGQVKESGLTLDSTVKRIDLSPAGAEVQIGNTVQLTATARDRDGNIILGVKFAWASSDPAIARVDSETGLVTAVTPGEATIFAVGDEEAGSTTVRPVEAPSVLPPIGKVLPVPVANNSGSITLATPSGDVAYLLIPYSLSTERGSTSFSLNNGLQLLPPATPRSREPEGGPLTHAYFRRLEDELARTRPPRARPRIRSRAAVGDQEHFFVISDSSGANFTEVTATLKRIGAHAYVYVDNATPKEDLTDAQVHELGSAFDNSIYEIIRATFGTESDVDGDPKITILFTPQVNLQKLAGFFYPHDLYDRPFSNQREMFYLRVPDEEKSFDDLRAKLKAVLAHEFQHMINFNEHVFVRGQSVGEVLWLNEALSHVAQDIAGYPETNVQFVKDYLDAPQDSSVARPTRDADEPERGAEYLFLRYVVDQRGVDLLKALVQTTQRDIPNVEAATGRSFAEWMRDWTATVFLSNSGLNSDSRYHYRSINLRAYQSNLIRLNGPAENELDFAALAVRGTFPYNAVRYIRVVNPTEKQYTVTIAAGASTAIQMSVIRVPSGHETHPPLPTNAFDGLTLDHALPSTYAPGYPVEVTGETAQAASQVAVSFTPASRGKAPLEFTDQKLNNREFSVRVVFNDTERGRYTVGIHVDGRASKVYPVEVK